MRITESRLRSIIRSVIIESQGHLDAHGRAIQVGDRVKVLDVEVAGSVYGDDSGLAGKRYYGENRSAWYGVTGVVASIDPETGLYTISGPHNAGEPLYPLRDMHPSDLEYVGK